MNSVERIRYYAQMPTEDWKGTASLPAPTSRGTWLDQGGLLLKNLTLAYRPHLPPALHGLSCQIKPGQKVGICGRTGAGKSTLLLVYFFCISQILYPCSCITNGNFANFASTRRPCSASLRCLARPSCWTARTRASFASTTCAPV
jgi:hypothetical protein